MRYFPAFIDVHLSPVLVVGGGEAAAQKVRLIRKTSARIKVIAAALNDELVSLANSGDIEWFDTKFRPDQLQGMRMVFAAEENAIENAGIAFAARSRSIPVNVVDQPQFCTFIVPAIIDRDPVLVAVGTEGTAPVLAQKIKSKIEALLPVRLGALANFAQSLRAKLLQSEPDGRRRRLFWTKFFDGPIAQSFLAGRIGQSRQLVRDALSEPARHSDSPGRIALVGAGPGDPDLLTFKAARLLQEADVILVDRLVNPAILEVARRDARRIFVGKKPGFHSVSQSQINEILVEEALAGHHVVRLKGGDPLIFGRAAEEIDAAHSAGITVDIVPGVTSALAAASRVAAPLTERGVSQALTVMTGHAQDGYAEHDWKALAKPDQSLAIYMGVGAAPKIERELLDAGMNPQTIVTVIENATLSSEVTCSCHLGDLSGMIKINRIKGPAIILIGPAPRLTETTRAQFERVA